MSLRDLFDKIEPHFEKGGRLENYYAVYEMVDTIFYTPGEVTTSASHVRDGCRRKMCNCRARKAAPNLDLQR